MSEGQAPFLQLQDEMEVVAEGEVEGEMGVGGEARRGRKGPAGEEMRLAAEGRRER